MSDEVELKPSEPEAEADVVIEENKIPEVIVDDEDSNEKVVDELTSIEREIAIMHDAEEDEVEEVRDSPLPVEESADKAREMQSDSLEKDGDSAEKCIKQSERRNGVTSVSELNEDPDSRGSPAQSKTVDTQLEHEDLLAVLKGTDDKDVMNIETGVTIEGEGEFQIVDIIDTDDGIEVDPLGKDSPRVGPLTKEEEHKLALEQFQSLKSSKNRRRKQDIKSISQPADLVTSLVSDWSDGDEANVEESKTIVVPKKKILMPVVQVKSMPQIKAAQEASTPAVSKVVVKEKPAPAQVQNSQKKVINTAAPTQVVSQPKKVINAVTVPQEKKTPVLPPPSPFKRTRIIKRKIIWDPDAPETQFSYAKLVKPSTPNPAKKEVKKERATPVPKKKEEPVAVETPAASSAAKRQVAAEPPNVINGNKKKKFSEVDRLLGDEGAVNMLNSLEGERAKRVSESEASRTPATRKTTPSVSPPERAQTPLRKESAQPKRRTPKPKASSSWDYVYKKQTEDAMIIRRRSNSSYSSSASINRLSVDGPGSAGKTPKSTPKSSPKTPQASPLASTPTSGNKTQDSEKQFEFAKPENKNKSKKMRSPIILVNSLSADMKKAAIKRPAKSPVTTVEAVSPAEPSDVWDVKLGNVRQVTFSTHSAKLSNTFTVKLMNELSQTLEEINEDPDCNAAVLVSEGPNFCQGIDFTDMALGTAEKRKNAAIQMSKAVKNFLSTLARFKKPLIAGVGGANSGLGVTMLPLFDVVIGSDKGTYETPYAKIGQIPEGFYIFSETPKVRSTFKNKLLWLAEKLHSTESALSGLVNKLTSVSKVNEEALTCAKKIASYSTETYTIMKERSLKHTLPRIITSLDEEETILVQQWCSASCVDNFKHFIHKGQW